MITAVALLLVGAGGGPTIKDIVVGKGPKAVDGDIVTVDYKGTLTSGKQFDSSFGKAPFVFTLGQGEVIRGWDMGVKGMRVGGKRQLVIPAALGYGAQGAPPDIPGGATLVFEVKLYRIEKSPGDKKIAIQDTKLGRGRAVKKGDKVQVHYRGKFVNGFSFDNSYDRKSPLPVEVGAGRVIKGFDDGLLGMKVGGKRIVTIPFMLGYGPQGRPPTIPAKSTLVFELELMKID